MNERALNRELATARGKATSLEPLLQKAWANVISAVAQQVVTAFSSGATMIASAGWKPPPDGELFDRSAAEKAAAKTRRPRERVLEQAAAIEGISFEIRAAAPQAFLDSLGSRADDVIAGIRPFVLAAVEQGFEEGLSVPDTGALIRSEVAAVTDWQAAALARTDLNALANAGNNLAVLQLNAASKSAGEQEFRVKRWLTANDDRVRDEHRDADGQEVPVDQPFTVGGERLRFPGDPAGSDENVINCRCVVVYAYAEAALPLAASAAPEATVPEGGNAMKLKQAQLRAVPETLASVTVTVDDMPPEEPMEPMDAAAQSWSATLLVEGDPTDDNRIMMPGSISWRQPPMTLMSLCETTEGGHMGAAAAGSIQSVRKVPTGTNAAGLETADFPASGIFDTGEFGQETARMVDEGTLGYVSADLAVREYGFRDPDTGEMFDPVTMSEADWIRVFMGGLQYAVIDGVIMGATVVPFSAFSESRIEMTASGEMRIRLLAPIRLGTGDLVACAAGPIAPPAEWFEDPKLNGNPTLLTVTPEGRVFGHAGTWDCHTGFADRCMRAQPSRNGYAQFHTGQVRAADGTLVPVGRMTVKPHAPFGASDAAVSAHYDDADRVAAFVRCYEDSYGIAVAGVTRSNAPPELLRDFLANPPSVDQRHGELLGFSSVPHPGLPVIVPQAYLVASGDGDAVVDTLLLPPVTEADVLLAAIAGPEADPDLTNFSRTNPQWVGEPLDEIAELALAISGD